MRILSGIQPSGKLHLGNYFGAIQQFLALQDQGEALFFIADLHALTTVRDPARLAEFTRDVALDYLALGLDPARATLFRQSDVPEVTELFWYLATICPVGLLERAVSFKDKVAKGLAPELGLFAYPVLMAADILLYQTDIVPVGRDQLQHLEITRDIAIKFNSLYVPGFDAAAPDGDATGRGRGILRVPTAQVAAQAALVAGIDGQKMSKSYGNTIDIFADENVLKKRIMSIKTDSAAVASPKDPNATPLFSLLQLFVDPAEGKKIEQSFRDGGLGYGHYKQQLLARMLDTLGPARQRRQHLLAEPAYVDDILAQGAAKARGYAASTLDATRAALGMLPTGSRPSRPLEKLGNARLTACSRHLATPTLAAIWCVNLSDR